MKSETGYALTRSIAYLRPALAWGSAVLGEEEKPSFYRSGFGLGAGASLREWSVGVDGRLAVGMEGRFAVLFPADQLDTQLTGLLVFELKL